VSDSSLDLTRGPLRVAFTRQRDRFGHTVFVAQDESWLPALVSIEGDDASDWPPSPAFQQASPGPNDSLLLVGMAGRSHWSAAVEGTDETGLVFDLAVRAQELPDWIGTSYHVGNHWRLTEASAARLRLEHASAVAIELVSENGGQWTVAIEQQNLVVVRFVVDRNDDPLPKTVRWKYRIVDGSSH
jgi:hypothetical protein